MSEINQALAELASKKTTTAQLQRAEIPRLPSSKPLLWIVVGFSLSLAVGGWAVTQSSTQQAARTTMAVSAPSAAPTQTAAPLSPTLKTPPAELLVPTGPLSTVATAQKKPEQQKNMSAHKQADDKRAQPTRPIVPEKNTANKPAAMAVKAVEKPQATSEKSNNAIPLAAPIATMVIEQVELTPAQLADKSVSRAEKALDAGDLQTALSSYNEALRYTAHDEMTRQKLATLYFSKGENRKAYQLLQTGINLNPEGETLRLALAKMLLKADQDDAALSPLLALSAAPSKDYLAMRAALAQKLKKDEIALESYQQLIQLDSDNARWWLGVAIQQERAMQLKDAKVSYQTALQKMGISSQSQRFIQERLKVLQELESVQ
ncbi:MSHA biogenesis protein MshN [Vibrio navarrensis]|uniref:tetratricopeptide repeat protein n=1 Tax=Vibrio navarrensis TaxID=29495 RepID=UPI001D04081F|nr:MSHA biogenesis protein MshN [Vibrio navarrensis]MBE4573813.1 MSHA biogenesis protein MshN [Vibrio navarrensis]